MAIVNVDLSEYDMLREAKKKAENEVKELKDTIKGLQDKSRVIITTKYPSFSWERAIKTFELVYDEECPWGRRYTLRESFSKAVSAGFSLEFSEYTAKNSSQYVGFEDVQNQVMETMGNKLKSELEKAIKEAEAAQEEYVEKLLSVDRDNAEKWKKKKQLKDSEIDKLNKRISELEAENKELSKTLTQKQEEAAITLANAQKQYDELIGKTKNKSLIKRIFG